MPKTEKWPSEGMDGMAAGTHHGCSPPPSEMSQIPAVEAEHHPDWILDPTPCFYLHFPQALAVLRLTSSQSLPYLSTSPGLGASCILPLPCPSGKFYSSHMIQPTNISSEAFSFVAHSWSSHQSPYLLAALLMCLPLPLLCGLPGSKKPASIYHWFSRF